MRFFLDENVDARVVGMLMGLGHKAWSAADANLYGVPDDTLTVYAIERNATLLTHDEAFSDRRRRNVVGRHVQLRCAEPDAVALLRGRLDELLPVLERASDVFVRLSFDAPLKVSYRWT